MDETVIQYNVIVIIIIGSECNTKSPLAIFVRL